MDYRERIAAWDRFLEKSGFWGDGVIRRGYAGHHADKARHMAAIGDMSGYFLRVLGATALDLSAGVLDRLSGMGERFRVYWHDGGIYIEPHPCGNVLLRDYSGTARIKAAPAIAHGNLSARDRLILHSIEGERLHFQKEQDRTGSTH